MCARGEGGYLSSARERVCTSWSARHCTGLTWRIGLSGRSFRLSCVLYVSMHVHIVYAEEGTGKDEQVWGGEGGQGDLHLPVSFAESCSPWDWTL